MGDPIELVHHLDVLSEAHSSSGTPFGIPSWRCLWNALFPSISLIVSHHISPQCLREWSLDKKARSKRGRERKQSWSVLLMVNTSSLYSSVSSWYSNDNLSNQKNSESKSKIIELCMCYVWPRYTILSPSDNQLVWLKQTWPNIKIIFVIVKQTMKEKSGDEGGCQW